MNTQAKHKDNFVIGFYYGNEKLDIYIPKDYKNDITIKSSSTDVDISGMSINSFDYNTKTGDLLMKSLIPEKSVIKTSSGDVNLKLPNDSQFYLKAKTASGVIFFNALWHI